MEKSSFGKENANLEQNVEIVNEFSEDSLAAILDLEKKCFPADWQYEDADDYYRKMLNDKENINIFLKQNAAIVGYALAKPLNNALSDLMKYDPEIQSIDNNLYIETIQVLDQFRGKGGAKKILLEICNEALKRGIVDFSIHARKSNGLNLKLRKIFDGMITKHRQIESWEPGGGEPYEYMEWSYKKNN
ncbi:MAG: GNAT family N-acetyltransferase [Parcubacteria group bacterium]|jgi:ribosomal protein S18 acetylase RimI-like enzyme